MSDPTPAANSGRANTLRRLLLGGAFAVTFLAGGIVMSSTPAAALTLAIEEGGMGAMHGMHGGAGMHRMAEAHIEKMLTAVDATPDQKAKIKAILHKGFESMAPMHQKMEATHADLHRILTAPTIDRAALEQLRADRFADFDQASKTMVQTIADAADVLTPQQRAKLGKMMADRHHPES